MSDEVTMEYTTRLRERIEAEALVNPQWWAILEVWREIERASRHVQIEWPGLISEWEEVQQEIIYKLVLDNYATVVQAMDPKPRKQVLFKIGTRIASEMAEDYDHFIGNYTYSTNEVMLLLDKGALDGVMTEGLNLDGVGEDAAPGVVRQDGAGQEVSARVVKVEPFDVRACFPRLSSSHQTILMRRFQSDVTLNGTERKEVTRAVDELTSLMNRARRKANEEHDGPGSRTPLSNAQALNKSRVVTP